MELILAYHLDELVSLVINRVSPNNKRELLTLLETKNKYLFELYILAEHDYHIARVMREPRPKVIDSLNHYNIGQLHNKRSISQSATTLPFLMTPHHSWFICQEKILQGNLAAAIDSLKTMSVSSNDYRKLMSLDPSNVLNGPFSVVNNAATDVMLLEWVEDVIGCRFTLQTTMSEQSVSSATASNPRNPSSNNEVSSNDEVSKSNGWLDVGTGKEWEKIVGYWRFSDVIIPSNDEKAAIIKSYNAMQSAQQHLEVVLAIADLSKYANHLYILKPNTATNHVRIERTTNPSVDPGEDHSKVKALCDIVFTSTLCSNVSSHVLYSPIPRGSGLDVGLYHMEPDRAKMTIELNICYERGNTVLQPLTYLLQRVCHNATAIWSLAVDIDGYFLIFIADKRIKIDKILIPNEEVASWRHVAVTIDTSASISTTYGTSAVITVYFDGKHVKQEVVDVPVVSEEALVASHLYLGSNMGCGWRMTEVRVWSDIRDSIEIEREKDNYLSLASKRKRLQLRVPTSKLFFSPFDDNIFDFTSVLSKVPSPTDTTAPTEVSVTGSTGSKLLRPLSMLKKKEL